MPESYGNASFTLTDGIDSGEDFVGTDGDDTYDAPLVDDPNNAGKFLQTLGGADELDGAGGTDKLEATLIDNAGSPELLNIQNLFLESKHDDAELDLFSADSVEQIWSDRSTNDLTVTSVQNAVAAGLESVRAGTDYDLTYDDDALDSTDYTQSVEMNGAGSSKEGVDFNITAAGDDKITGLDVTASDTNNIDLGAGLNDLTTVTQLSV